MRDVKEWYVLDKSTTPTSVYGPISEKEAKRRKARGERVIETRELRPRKQRPVDEWPKVFGAKRPDDDFDI